jgi:hypothetical protein
MLGLPAASLSRNTRSEMSLPIRFGGMGVGDLVAFTDAAHVGAAGLSVGSAIRFLTTQDARVCGDSQDEVSMEPTMYGQLATAMTTSVSRMHAIPDGDDGDNEPMRSLELASSWARSSAACGFHALAESEPLITIALAMLPPQCPTVARAGCVAEARSNNEHIARSLDGLPSLIPFFAFARTSFQSYKPISMSASFCFASRISLPRFITALGRGLGFLYHASAMAPLRFWLRTRILRVA